MLFDNLYCIIYISISIRGVAMANQNKNQQNGNKKERQLLLSSLFTDAPVRVEPEEPQKVVVAGLAEAREVKEYPDTYFRRAFKIFGGEFGKLFKSSLFFILFTVPFIIIFAWFAGFFENMQLGGTYVFVNEIGIGLHPEGGDSLVDSVARLIWEVKEPVILMLAATLLLGSLGLSGNMYCAKRNYYQNYYSKCTKTYFMGFAKYWWFYFIEVLIEVLVGSALVTAIMYLMKQQTLGVADAGAYCAVVFSWIFGLPIMLVPVVVMPLYTSYNLTFAQAIKNAFVLIVNCPITICLIAALSALPLIIIGVGGNIFGIIVYIVMAIVGCNLFALLWMAMINKAMTKCHELKANTDKIIVQKQRQEARNDRKNSTYEGAKGGQAKKKDKKQVKPYQNPKKKKKK